MSEKIKECPQCHGPIERVRNSGWLNDDQFDSAKAGDYFCRACPDNDRGQSGLCYWWERELPDPPNFQI